MPVEYTRALLAQAAAAATSLDEMLTALGREPTHDKRTYLRRKITQYGIDTSHFRPTGSIYTREVLQEAVAASHSVAGVVRHLPPLCPNCHSITDTYCGRNKNRAAFAPHSR
ncbi:hypothetical protein [Streptomyces sp. NRRL WC-3742]|uniref:hypothetical protein n=1 Tax=Streptomyces sp. NRRL WC-3742 TaxID=1463934 RepID=UPI0004CB4C68|nr:hypothetical protein [Streptomyces sp. NRRL WC-3742]